MNNEKAINKLAEQVKDIIVHKLNQAVKEDYSYAAFDKDGSLCAYKEKPSMNEALDQWEVDCVAKWKNIHIVDHTISNWKETCTEINKPSYINWKKDKQEPNDRFKYIRGYVKKNNKHLFNIIYGLDHCDREFTSIRCIVDDRIDTTYSIAHGEFKTMSEMIEHCKKIAEDFYKSQIEFAKEYL